MIKLDEDLLQELGLATLPPEEKKKLLAHIYETLEMRVGMKLAEQMTDAQLTEFEQFIDRNDQEGALKWLESKFPHYKDVVSAEFERLKSEIKQVASQILAASQGQQTQPQAFSQPTQPAAQSQSFPPGPPQGWQGNYNGSQPQSSNTWQGPSSPPPPPPPPPPSVGQAGGDDDRRKDNFGLAA